MAGEREMSGDDEVRKQVREIEDEYEATAGGSADMEQQIMTEKEYNAAYNRFYRMRDSIFEKVQHIYDNFPAGDYFVVVRSPFAKGASWYKCKGMAMNDDQVAEVAKKGFEESMKLANELLIKGGLHNKCKAPEVLCGHKGGNKFVQFANEVVKPQMSGKPMGEILQEASVRWRKHKGNLQLAFFNLNTIWSSYKFISAKQLVSCQRGRNNVDVFCLLCFPMLSPLYIL